MWRSELTVPVVLLVVFAGMTATASGFPPAARLMPVAVGVPAVLLTLWELWRAWRGAATAAPPAAPSATPRRGAQPAALAWFVAFVLAIVAGGFVAGGMTAVVALQRFWLGESWRNAGIGGVAAFVVLAGGVERGLGQPLFEGIVTGWARGWLGL